MAKGYLNLVLHAHLPFVRHPEYSDSFEEDWYYEAITETYLPLLLVMEKLLQENIDYRITFTVSPPLMEMLADPFLQDRYQKHLEKLIELSEKEVHRTQNEPDFNSLAKMYLQLYRDNYRRYMEDYHRDLVSGFRRLLDSGKVEIITCGATHGFLPLMEQHPEAVRAQIQVAANNYRKHLGRDPKGIWLPECGYFPGAEKFLKEAGISYFYLDTHGILFAKPRPAYGIYAPVYCPNGTAAFGRDPESSKQVWSSKEGYPGDFDYREFYRDIGYDLPLDYIRPYIHESGQRINTGIKYYRITGVTDHKDPYNPDWAREKAALHAGNFMHNREKQVDFLASVINRAPVIVAPYDAELYGHWWFEGPQFLDFLFRKMHFDQHNVKPILAAEYINLYPENQIVQPIMSSWGYKGYAEFWLENSNDWIYRHLHWAAKKMTETADRFTNPDPLQRRALNQMARELLLAQSSDWAFIMKTGTHVEYARNRTKTHILNFIGLLSQLGENRLEEAYLAKIEGQWNIFSEIDYTVYQSGRA